MPPVPAIMSENAASLIELFSSIQGEGVLIGRRQVFLRFSGCNLSCRYCDTSFEPEPFCRIETVPGHNEFTSVANPVALDTIVGHLAGWQKRFPNLHHSLSVTGGEPLLQPEILQSWLTAFQGILPVFLETNGLLVEHLRRVIHLVEYISMDIKLPSTSGYEGLWDQHLSFLRLAASRNCYVKAVVSLETDRYEIGRACELIAEVSRDIPLILQPETSELTRGGMGRHLLDLQEHATKILQDVRVLPQLHTIMRLL